MHLPVGDCDGKVHSLTAWKSTSFHAGGRSEFFPDDHKLAGPLRNRSGYKSIYRITKHDTGKGSLAEMGSLFQAACSGTL